MIMGDIASLERRVQALEVARTVQEYNARLDAKIDAMVNRLTIRLFAIVAVQSGVIIAVQKLWP